MVELKPPSNPSFSGSNLLKHVRWSGGGMTTLFCPCNEKAVMDSTRPLSAHPGMVKEWVDDPNGAYGLILRT